MEVHFGSQPIKPKEKKPKDTTYGGSIYPSDSDYGTDGSWFPGRDDVPDTPLPETARQKDMGARYVTGFHPVWITFELGYVENYFFKAFTYF